MPSRPRGRARRPGARAYLRRRLQLPVASPVRYARELIADGELGDHELPGPVLLDVRVGPAQMLSGASRLDQAGYGVTTDLLSHTIDLAHAIAAGADHARGRHDRDVHRASGRWALPGAGHYGRGAPGHPHGAVTNEDDAGMLCEFAWRRARVVRVEPHDHRAREPDGLRRARHAAARRPWNLERAQRAAALPAQRRPWLGLHHRLPRRPLPRRRAAPGSGQCERDRLRGPRGDRGLRVLPLDRRGAPARTGLRGGGGVGQRPGSAVEVRADGTVGALVRHPGRTDGHHGRRPPPRPCGSPCSASAASAGCMPSSSPAKWPGVGQPSPWCTTSTAAAAAAVGAALAGCRLTSEVDAVLASSDVDAVAICSSYRHPRRC